MQPKNIKSLNRSKRLSFGATLRILRFVLENKQWRTLGWYWRSGYFHTKPPVLGLNYNNGIGECWADAKMFVPRHILVTLEHNKTYETKEICSWWIGKDLPKKVKFTEGY